MSSQIHELRVESVGDHEVVHVSGEIDLSNAATVLAALDGTASAGVALDLGELAYFDSAGIRAVDQAFRSFEESGRDLVVVVPAESRADWIFRVTGLAPALVAGSLPEALAVLRERRGGSS